MVRSGLIRVAAVLTAFHALAVGLALALLVAAMKLGLFGDVTIMFYRGLVDLAAITPILMLVLAGLVRLRWVTGVLAARDAVAATLVAISLNLAAFVLGPVTVDRSVSVYMLSRLAGDFAQGMARLEDDIARIVGMPFNPGSPKQLGDILFGQMGLPGGKKTATGSCLQIPAAAR